ncbi:excinuclease ABC subunit UvrA [Ktedonosporobacter rubrisoli]|uniref:UvrABC system protein A n=1 Tax=Ktedonosporobacter rubrisoli TaxID=2509675 RepID=A0A4P6JTZ8_KTERU|nr:excinuclease ABC subunit UvrA [Ktedonosporobacter rubrisoli]QBD79078.1 excinuclease ABC subunit UvrA [Ktedonosporobacter rubrisoli]
MPQDKIVVRGAREHNLKNIDVTIPRDKLVVITGLSGSGKSSLAFDTIFAEGQRRYVESLSAYARQFLDKMDKPDVDHIDGLSPAISIDQKGATHNPRSTVGTVTEIYDYLRLLYARVGHQHCPKCGREVSQQTIQQIVDAVLSLPDGSRILLLAPLIQGRKGEYKNVFEEMRRAGYVRVRVDGQIQDLSEEIELDKQKKHTIEVVVDRLVIRKGKKAEANGAGSDAQRSPLKMVAERPALYEVKADEESAEPAITQHEDVDPAFRQRLSDSLETTLKLGNGVVLVSVIGSEEILFSEKAACVYCGISLPEIAPRSFSFNSPHGACPTCTGLGTQQEIDAELIVTHPELSIRDGAIAPWSKVVNGSQWHSSMLEALAERFNFSLDTPWNELSEDLHQKIMYGVSEPLTIRYTPQNGHTRNYTVHFEGVIPSLDKRYKQTESEGVREEIEGYMTARVCPDCRGARLKPEALAVTIGGRNVVQVTSLSIVLAQRFFQQLESEELSTPTTAPAQSTTSKANGKKNGNGKGKASSSLLGDPLTPIDPQGPLVLSVLSAREQIIARQILKEIRARLQFLIDVGLDYLTLNRAAMSLSGGEAQRIRLATQIGSGLMGVLYILDEPSIGLHQRDNERLIKTLVRLRNLGNTLLVVEHDEDTMRTADYIIDIGPGAGEHGGKVVAAGTYEEIVANHDSLTGDYLAHRKSVAIPEQRRPGNGQSLLITGARENNLKNVDVEVPLGKFVVVTGVSGSGKSTLITDILYRKLSHTFHRSHERPGEHDEISGLENLDKVIDIDQSPIGRTPRSNPATYTNAFTGIRELFAQVPESRIRGYQPGRFSFNVKGGRCEACKGEGIVRIEMNFLPDVYVPCEVCHGKRYNREALEIHYKGKSIADVLDMTVEEATAFFSNVPSIYNKMKTLNDVGLGYMRLGQPATTLSGGEAQRVKLATELSRRATGRTLYILDEPTTGLHFADVERLLEVLQRLVDAGNTIVVIEHNLDVIKSADWIIDLGPEGGDNGGRVIAQGTPEEVAENEQSYTGHFLQRLFNEVSAHAIAQQIDPAMVR